MSNLNPNYDSNDFDTFLNLDNDFNTPISASSSTTLSSAQPSFSGPSHQYESHRQQTGLPMGALASTIAVNQANGLHYRQGNMGFVMPTETLNMPLSNLEDYDFGPRDFSMNEMDFDAPSPNDVTSMFNGSGSTHIKTESAQSTPVQRIYPGMHSQQAKLAAQQKQDMIRQSSQQKQVPGQLPLPTQAPKSAKDPHVEESISRLLNRMRQSSTSSVDEATPGPSANMAGIARSKKDEDDMDEDERLLASEEGKKLSSKERRQLRNKVSARAFRSRRKEYIGQLEGEVAAKVQEANDLRVQNQQLMEENTRLTDLTRMLLSSQAFSGFLQELSQSGMTLPSNIPTQPLQQTSQPRKDIPVHEAARQLQGQNQQQVGMTLIPETQVDTNDYVSNWNMPLPSNDFQVYSVTTMPEPPVLDLEPLTEKATVRPVKSAASSKDIPQLSALPAHVESTNTADAREHLNVMKEDDDSADLYAASSQCSATSTHSAQSLIASLQKPVSTVSTCTSDPIETETELSSKLRAMCSEMEESCARIENFLP